MITVVAAIVAAAVASSACGGGSDSEPAQGDSGGAANVATSAPNTGGTASTPAANSSTLGARFSGSIPAGAAVIDQVELLFKPTQVSIKLGETVYFTNGDAAIHSVNVDAKNILGPGVPMKQKEVATWKPAKAGTYKLTCDYHPAMKATVTVQ